MLDGVDITAIGQQRPDQRQVNERPNTFSVDVCEFAIIVNKKRHDETPQTANRKLQRGIGECTGPDLCMFHINAPDCPKQAGGETCNNAPKIIGFGHIGQVIAEEKQDPDTAKDKSRNYFFVEKVFFLTENQVDDHQVQWHNTDNQRRKPARNVFFCPANGTVADCNQENAGKRLFLD